ncbi:hypothetical protein [Cellulomonas sp. P22]|uniref:hypothetical protein n=1 Tax=Cellulomonas sp. P22 TaxID=3373189 RepID=UPI0037BE4D57
MAILLGAVLGALCGLAALSTRNRRDIWRRLSGAGVPLVFAVASTVTDLSSAFCATLLVAWGVLYFVGGSFLDSRELARRRAV